MYLFNKSRYIIILVLILLISIPTLSAEDTRTLKVSLSVNAPLVFTDENGEPGGFLVDILNYIAEEESWNLQFVPGTWKECLDRLANGEIDIVMSISRSEEREVIFDFTEEAVINNWGQLLQYSDFNIENIIELQNNSIAIVKGNIHSIKFIELLNEFDVHCDIVEVDDYDILFNLINKGEVTAGISNRLNILKYMDEYANVKKTSIIFNPINLYFATTKSKNADIRAAIDRHIKELKADPNSIFYEALDRWLETNLIERVVFPEWLKWVIIAISFLVLLLGGTSILLKREVTKRTAVIYIQTKELEFAHNKLERKFIDKTAEFLESEEKYRTLFHLSPNAMMLSKADGEISEVNNAMSQITGYTIEEIKKLGSSAIIAPEVLEETIKDWTSQVKDRGCFHIETLWLGKNGQRIPVAVSGKPIKIKNDELYIVIGADISEIKKAEEELNKFQKLESIGILAGGIAHDFNNILTGILANLSFARTTKDLEKKEKSLTSAENASLRAKDLSNQLLTFSRGGEPVKKTISMEKLVRESAIFSLRGSHVSLEFSIPPKPLFADVDGGQMDQVISNICINAIQAMPKGGILKINCENITLKENNEIFSLNKGNYIKISIADKGIGIPSDHLRNIFDPYYSTKQKGSGLGLTTVYSIIKKHKGHISVESELEKGTVFHIYIPASEEQIPEEKEKEENTTAVRKGKILVMDDDETIREVVCMNLNSLGFTVESAKDGKEAIELYNKALKSGASYDLLILDLTVPGGMGGKETIKILKKINSEVKVIVSSGYSNDPIMSNYIDYGFSGTLIKPYDIDDLNNTVNHLINEK